MTWMESGARRGSRHRCGQNGLFADSVALFASAIGQIGEAVVITNTSATIQYVNRAFTKLAGYGGRRQEHADPEVRLSGPHLLPGLWKTILSGEVWQGELGLLEIFKRVLTSGRPENCECPLDV
jgi:PAS domain-containing protein